MLESLCIALASGLAIGLIVGALGAGGGVLTFPALVYLLGQEPHTAGFGSLIVVLCTSTIALPGRIKRKQVKWQRGTIFGLFMALGSLSGGAISGKLHGNLILILFGLLVLSMAGVMAYNARQTQKEEQLQALQKLSKIDSRAVKPLWMVALVATLTGFLTTGLFGVGGGFMIVPMLVLALGLEMRDASGTSQIVKIIAILFALLPRLTMQFQIDWLVIVAFTSTSMLGGILGVPLSEKAEPSTLKYIFSLLLLAVAALTIGEQLLT